MIENGHLVKAKNVLIKEFSQEEAVKMNVKRYFFQHNCRGQLSMRTMAACCNISFMKEVQCRQTGRKKEFAIMLPDKVREAILRVTRNYVAERSETGDFSNRVVNNAADLIYATLYEWTGHGMHDDRS